MAKIMTTQASFLRDILIVFCSIVVILYSIFTMISGKIALHKVAPPQSDSKDRIVRNYKHIKNFVVHCRGLGLKVVLVQGTWDMVHVGHARYLESAKKYGDILIVGVDDDKKVKHRKGPDRPVVPEEERLEMLTYLRPVDIVFLKRLNDPKWRLIKTISTGRKY